MEVFHCESASSAMVAIGMVNWDARPVFLETVDQTNMFTHPEYESIGTKNDIALLKLNKKIYFDGELLTGISLLNGTGKRKNCFR